MRTTLLYKQGDEKLYKNMLMNHLYLTNMSPFDFSAYG
jgi:hypothetical protein